MSYTTLNMSQEYGNKLAWKIHDIVEFYSTSFGDMVHYHTWKLIQQQAPPLGGLRVVWWSHPGNSAFIVLLWMTRKPPQNLYSFLITTWCHRFSLHILWSYWWIWHWWELNITTISSLLSYESCPDHNGFWLCLLFYACLQVVLKHSCSHKLLFS